MAFTEFYMQSGGSNLNAGSTNNNTATYSSASGNWTQSTRVFTPTDGSTPASTVSVGMFASVYLNAATTAVYIGRVSAVGAGVNGTITCNTSGSFEYGAAPANSTGGMSIKVGGAWTGPSGTATFPLGLSGNLVGNLQNTSNNCTRLNAKNDQTYTMTAALPFATLGTALLQGYSSTPGDGGQATFTSNLTSTNFTIAGNSKQGFADLVFANTGASGSGHVFDSAVNGVTFNRVVFKGGRGSGLNNSGSGVALYAVECEAYDDNKSNGSSLGGFSTTSAGFVICVNCYSHDHASGSNAHAYSTSSSGGTIILFNSIADTVAGNGMNKDGSVGPVFSFNSNYYNITGDAIKFVNSNQAPFSFIFNNNFTKSGGKAINNTLASQGGIIYSNGRGAGSEANGSADALGSIVDTSTDITYPSNASPYNAQTTGDFSLVLAQAIGVGRGAFTETDGTNTGTVGYPDIGAAQAEPYSIAFKGGDTILAAAFIGHVYEMTWTFPVASTLTLDSGSLPAGLSLSTLSSTQAQITGTPTAPTGTSDFALKLTVGASYGVGTFHITVYNDPDEGVGGVGGG